MLLRPEYWKGQQEGDSSSQVHARCMKPLCEIVSTNPISSDPAPKDMALFMPYLHWETDRARTRAADVIQEASRIKFCTLGDVVEKVTANEQNHQYGQAPPRDSTLSKTSSRPQSSVLHPKPITNQKSALGQLLRLAANLAEAIDQHLDEKMLYEYLHADPPLQPRRTLDQSYYRTLKTTYARDRDQVVYRETIPWPHECEMGAPAVKCRECKEDSRKVPRLIMVDQLWMWILDEKTVITSFPRRWGKNRGDFSAIHKSLRTRLKFAQQDEIRSAYDLALMIVDQCSKVFFDRTIISDRRPNLVGIFADAISRITYSQSAAFDQFLIYTHLASNEYNSYNSWDQKRSWATQNTLLNVNPEGNLLKEVKDILDELHILMQIEKQQQTVAHALVKNVRTILRPKLCSTTNRRLAIPDEADWLNSDISYPRKIHQQVEDAKLTLGRADNLLEAIEGRILELKTLQEAARYTSSALKDILTLKQQQAGVVEAREAVKQATETLKQGRSIMLFTVVTIVFLPLSFCAAIFGMNTAEFNGGLMSLHDEFVYMFPISIAIITTSFLLAFTRSTTLLSFTSLISTTILYPFRLLLTFLLTKSGIYTLSKEATQKANVIKDKERRETGTMKGNALREMMELKAVKAVEERWRAVGEGEGEGGHDVERGLGRSLGMGRSGSELGLVFSPRI